MNVHAYLPIKPLSPFVRSYLIIETEEEMANRVLPDTSLVMVFRYAGRIGYWGNEVYRDMPPIVVSGLRKSGRRIHYSTGTGNILVLLKEAAAGAFIKEPLHELFEESISLGDCSGYRHLSLLEEQLAEAGDGRQRINLIEQFLLSKLYDHRSDPLILTALEVIRRSKGVIRIRELADGLFISQDAFEKRFRRIVGVSPKQFSFIIRMRSVISTGLTKQTLSDLAFNAGYFDQPHFNKDFKLFTGQTPTDFFKAPLFW